MKKKILTGVFLFVLCFGLILVPNATFGNEGSGAGGDDTGTTTVPIVEGYYQDGVWQEGTLVQTLPNDIYSVNKTAERDPDNPNKYIITLEVIAKKSLTTQEVPPSATILIVDTSGSMEYYPGQPYEDGTPYDPEPGEILKIDAVKEAARDFIETYAGETQNTGRYLALETFNRLVDIGTLWVDVSTPEGKAAALAAINNIDKPDGGTNMHGAFLQAGVIFDNPPAGVDIPSDNKNVVLLSDGAPTFYLMEHQDSIFWGPTPPDIEIGGQGYDIFGDGRYGSQMNNQYTANAAADLKEKTTIYAIGFGTAQDPTYSGGPSVDDYLSQSIASSENHFYSASNREELNKHFQAISDSITDSLEGEATTVIDGGAPFVSAVQLPEGVALEDGDFSWVLGDSSDFIVDNVTYHKYDMKYTVELDKDADGFNAGQTYPLNGETYFDYPNGDGTTTRVNFPIPGTEGIEDTYDVTHEFVSGTEGKDLPAEVIALIPEDQTGKTNGTQVTPTQPTQTEVVVEGGKWVFEGYDKENATIEGAGQTFTGTWEFVEDTYDVTHEFVSGTEGKDLPAEVIALIPEDQTGKTNGTQVTPTQPTQTEVVVEGGKWVFEGYDKENATIEGADQTFTGTWEFVEDTYDVTHEFVSGTEGKDLPAEVIALIPEDQTGKTNGTQVTPTAPTQTEVVVEGGKWVFEGYDKENATIEGADQTFTGTWEFVEDTYDVTHEFVSGTEGKDLPAEVIALIPEDQTGKTNGTQVTPTQPTQTEVVVEGGKWVFEGYDRDGDTIEGADENFVGTWEFVEDTYDVTHEFTSGTEGKELPEEVKKLIPEDQTGKTNGTQVTPTQPTQTEVVVEGGKWVFEGYDKENATIEGADQTFTGTWEFVEDTYDVTHEFVSGTEGKDLPAEVIALIPEDQTGKTNGTQVTPTQPTQTEVVVEGGKWVFEGYDKENATIEGADQTFTGTWEFVEDTYDVTHEFVSGTEGKDLPAEVIALIPEDQTGKTNGTQVTPTQPTQTEVVVEGGKWVFEGYDKENATIEGADQTFTGTWEFVEDTYDVTHEFVSGTEGKDLPAEVIALIPEDQTGKTNGTQVTPTQPTQTEVVVEGGKWVFEGYDKENATIEGADQTFTGTWEFVEDTYDVTHEFVSGTEGKDLPAEVIALIPEDQTGKTNGTQVTPTQPTQTEVVVEGGKWVFEGYDKENATIEGADQTFTGTWEFVEDTYDVTHEFVSGTEGKDLPAEVIALIPEDQTGKTNGTQVTPTQPTQTEVVVEGGKWVFEGYDRDGDTIEGADENFVGTWEFVEDTYNVTHEFVSGTEGKDLPAEVIALIPEDQTGKTNGTQVTPTQPTQTEVVVEGGKWVFEGYDRDGDTIEGADENFVGTWEFVEDTYDVTHEFVSGTEGKDLPAEVIALIPEDQTGKTNGTQVTPTQPTQTEVVVEGGKWVFEGYDKENATIEGADQTFTGTWEFVEDTYDVTHEFVSGTEGKDLPAEVIALIPEDQTGKTNGTQVTPTAPTQTEVVVEGGKWVFEGYDKENATIEGADQTFTGTWEFVEDTYDVTHEFVSGTEGKDLPAEVIALIPEDQTGKTNGTQVTPTQPTQTEVVVEGGKWVFEGYDKENATIEGADQTFTGTWEFVEDTYDVTHEFVSGTEGKDLPAEVIALIPEDQTRKTNGTQVTPTQPTQTEVVVEGGKWVFEGYDKENATIEGADQTFTGTWEFVEDTYDVTHEFVSGTEGKDLPAEVIALIPEDQTGKTNGTQVTPTQPTQTEVVVEGGKWVFEGYDKENATIEGADENFVGTWEFVEDTYDVTHEFTSGTEGKELPEEVKKLIPEDQTGKTNGTQVTPTQPTQTEVVVEGGKWVFEGYDRDGDTIEGADENFVGTWEFVEDTYDVTHEFVSGTEGKDLPAEVIALIPEDQTGKTNGTQVTPTQPTQTEVVVEGGKWVFEGYDRDGDTIEGADENFVGTWEFVEDTYNVTHEFVSGTEGKDLPAEVIALIPEDQTGKTNGTQVTPTQPTQTEVVVEGGKWVFEGYDKENATIEGADENFVGTWEFVEDTYNVTHEFVSGTEGKELPEEVKKLIPEDQTGKTNGTQVTPTQPTQTEVVVEGGKWVFEGYDRDGDTIEGADENFVGTWEFVEDTYNVTHEFVSGTEGKELPEEVKKLIPEDQTGKTNGTEVTPTAPTQTEVVVEGGKWVFEGYDRDGDTIEGADENFVGTWVFVEDTYNVTHEFTSGTEGKELPEEVKKLIPEDQTGKTNGTEVTPTAPTQTEVVVEGGKWVFQGYDRNGDTIEGADENFVGIWVFVEDTPSETPNPEYPKPQDPKPVKPVEEATEPNTGDNSNVAIWVLLMMLSGGCLMGVNVARKKQKNL